MPQSIIKFILHQLWRSLEARIKHHHLVFHIIKWNLEKQHNHIVGIIHLDIVITACVRSIEWPQYLVL